MKTLLAFLTVCCACALSAKILAIFPIPSVSHQVVYQPIWSELARLGHQVTVITSHPVNDARLNGTLTETDVGFLLWPENKKYDFSKIVAENGSGLFNIMDAYRKTFHHTGELILENVAVREIVAGKRGEFDLVMVEMMHPPFFAFAHRFKCPFIGVTSLESPGAGHRAMGNPTHPLLYPDVASPFDGQLTFKERVISVFLFFFYAYYEYGIILPEEDESVLRHFGPGYPPLIELRKNVDMLFINANPALQPVRPTVPGTVYIGGGIHLKKPKPLPKDIKQFLDNAKEGVVYFSLGSNVKSKDIPDKTRQVILETFREMPYKILWKFEAESLPGKPDNVHIMKWIPQQDVLRHPNIKLFITQGGLQSTEEAIFSHVPIVVMPFFGDQEMNAKRIVSKGFGLSVDHKTLVKEEFKKVLTEVLNNKIYRDKAKELAELALDEPMTGLEKAIWWTEYVLRHKGAKHLKGPAVNLPLYQYYFLDVIAFIMGILAVLITILVLIFKCLKCFLCGKKRKVKTN